jgi:hypothetical protein
MTILQRLQHAKISAAGGVLAGFLTFAIGIIATALFEVPRHAASMTIVGWNGWSVAILSAGLAVNWLALLFMIKRVEELQSRNRIAFQYFDRNSAVGRIDLLNMVKTMEPDAMLLILNYFTKRSDGHEPATEAVRKLYMEELERKLDVIHYRRILQADPAANLSSLLDETHLSHFRAVIETRDHGGSGKAIQIARTALKYPYSFLIMKNPSGRKYFTLDIVEESPSTDHFRIIGSLHVTDPEEQLIAPFEALFRSLEGSPDLVNIRLEQLSESTAPSPVA